MGIDVQWQDEDGIKLGEVHDSGRLLARFIESSDHDGSKCLGFIDPWGDTFFNRRQIPVLIEELRGALEPGCPPELRRQIESVVAIGGKALDEVHTYLMFVGD
jgi:hypothetical protein